jgi:ubiquinone/menaquinone biosynthesis C-methylase UbiE
MRVDYDTISATYDGFRGVNAELAKTILREAAPAPGARMLDIGCGTGNIEGAFAEAALAGAIDLSIVGVDLSFGMLAEAKSKIPGVDWVQADSNALPLGRGAFDCAIMLYMLHHLTNFHSVIEGVYDVLHEGRFVILTASHEQIDDNFSSRFFPSYAEIDKARFPKIDDILQAMRGAGFSDLATREINVAKVTLNESYLTKVENKHVSTFLLMDDEEFTQGMEKMRRYVSEHEGYPPIDHRGTLISGMKANSY